jgi:hypothetical protein
MAEFPCAALALVAGCATLWDAVRAGVALSQFGALVHYLEVGAIPMPEAQGLAAIVARARSSEKTTN